MNKGMIGLLIKKGLENIFSENIKTKKRRQRLKLRMENLKNEQTLLRLDVERA
jgi:hypothetical protein